MLILFVCLGNICRSPIAEGVLRHKAKVAGLDWQIESAGTESSHIGEVPHKFSQKICLEHGVDISAQCARRFTAADLRRWDLIYPMATDVLEEIYKIGGRMADYSHVKIFLSELNPGRRESVPDPWYGDETGYRHVYELINKTCDKIIERYAAQGKRL